MSVAEWQGPNMMDGVPVYGSLSCTVQFRFPRTKKHRIRRKWANRPENRKPDLRFFHFPGFGYYGHPAAIARLNGLMFRGAGK